MRVCCLWKTHERETPTSSFLYHLPHRPHWTRRFSETLSISSTAAQTQFVRSSARKNIQCIKLAFVLLSGIFNSGLFRRHVYCVVDNQTAEILLSAWRAKRHQGKIYSYQEVVTCAVDVVYVLGLHQRHR